MSRTTSREHAFKILFQMQFVRETPENSVGLYLDSFVKEQVEEDDRTFMLKEVSGVKEHQEELDQKIEGALKGWSLYRLSKVDLNILRLSLYEILYDQEIPVSVSINEAVNLARKYSLEASPSFINGILGTLAAQSGRELDHE